MKSNEHLPERQSLRLDQFLKLCGVAGTGGQAKLLIQGGEVLVNSWKPEGDGNWIVGTLFSSMGTNTR